MKKLTLQSLFVILSCFIPSCQTNETWYLGEWTNGEESFILTKESYINTECHEESTINIVKQEDGKIRIYLCDFIECPFFLFDPHNKRRMWSVDEGEDGEWEILSEYHKKGALNSKPASASEPKESNDERVTKIDNSDKAWKAAFEDGYLILTWMDEKYRKDIVLKGYGDNYKHGKVTTFGGNGRTYGEVGIYSFDDGVLLFNELMGAAGYLADDVAIEGRIFDVSFSPSITITEYREPAFNVTEKRVYKQTKIRDVSFSFRASTNPHPRIRRY